MANNYITKFNISRLVDKLHTEEMETTNTSDTFTHYDDVIMGAIASQITSLTIVYSTVYSDADQRKHQSSASLAFVRRIHQRQVNSPHKWPVTQKMFPFDDVIMKGFLSSTYKKTKSNRAQGISTEHRCTNSKQHIHFPICLSRWLY